MLRDVLRYASQIHYAMRSAMLPRFRFRHTLPLFRDDIAPRQRHVADTCQRYIQSRCHIGANAAAPASAQERAMPWRHISPRRRAMI